MPDYKSCARIAGKNLHFIIGKQILLCLVKIHVHKNSGHPSLEVSPWFTLQCKTQTFTNILLRNSLQKEEFVYKLLNITPEK